VAPELLQKEDIDVVLLQRPHELGLVQEWTGRTPGLDLPAVYVEHNTPGGEVPYSRHPLADQNLIPVVHVTYFNELFWDTGIAPTSVVEHGVVDPGYRYSGELPRAAVVVNEPKRRGRAVGADLLPVLSTGAPIDVFGMGTRALTGRGQSRRLTAYESLTQAALHDQLPRRRVYLHPNRWTSLGLSLIEAMLLGMPVVALAAAETAVSVPPGTGVVSTRLDEIAAALRHYLHDRALAEANGRQGRAYALRRFGLARFLSDWDDVLVQTASRAA
jgi:glycosyltransferase involved in cell wall biosynthesis